MKLFFKLTILVCLNANAREIILITHNNDFEKANRIKTIIETQEQIPRSYIRIVSEINPCRDNVDAILKLCVDNGKMRLVRIRRQVIKSMQMFKGGN